MKARGQASRSHAGSSKPAACIALLRAVNVAGRNAVAMGELRRVAAAAAGIEDVRSLMQSGNLVFRGNRPPAELEALLERAVQKELGLATHFFVRTASEWRTAIAANPFPEEAERDPAHLVLVALREAPSPSAVKALQQAIAGNEQVRVQKRTAYIVYPDGIGRSKLTAAVIEKQLGTRGTGRNWNTVLKLATLAESL